MVNKKGNVAAAIIAFVMVIVILFAFININLWGDTLLDEMGVEITTSNGYTNESVAAMTSTSNNYTSVMDGIGMLIFIGLWLLSLIFAYNGSNNPFLAFLAIIIVVIVGLVGMILSNTWEDISTDPDINGSASGFTLVGFVLTNYLTFVIVMGLTMVLSMFLGARQI